MTSSRSVRRALAALGCGVLLLAGPGCSAGRRGHAAYVPPEPAARQALEAALDAWQRGEAPGRVGTASPAVQVADSFRRPGQTLQRYEILGEVAGEGPRCFAVRLVLDNPPEERKARYLVLGLDPLWVLSPEDYEMLAHWEMKMEGAPRARK